MIVRLTYDDGTTEDHKLINGVHFADYIRRVDVRQVASLPSHSATSKFAISALKPQAEG